MAKRRPKKQHVRFQIQQKFWLDGNKAEEGELADWCDVLREERRFTNIVRNGLMLMRELMEGKTDLLFKLFPALYQDLFAKMEADVMEKLMHQRESEAITRLERLESMLSNLNTAPALPASSSGIRQLAVQQFDVPPDDEEDEPVLIATEAQVDGAVISANFLRSLGTL